MVRRSIHDIYFDVLKVIGSGVDKPTRIMYKANLAWSTMQNVFKRLIDGGFITVRYKNASKRYYLTDKGRRAVYYHMKSMEGLIPLRAS